MRYDVVPIRGYYRGIERSLLATDLFCRNKGNYHDLLELYYDYLAVMEQAYSETNFERVVSFFRTLVKSGISCEVIVYDHCPQTTAYGYCLEFLGIDIACDLAESLLCGCDENIKTQLNNWGLCTSLSNVEAVMRLLNQGNAQWDPCYVYKVSIGNSYES